MSDPVAKLKAHLNRYGNSERMVLPTETLQALLDEVERLRLLAGDMQKITVIALTSAASEIRELQGRVDELTRAGN
jgi:hypothetical protein